MVGSKKPLPNRDYELQKVRLLFPDERKNAKNLDKKTLETANSLFKKELSSIKDTDTKKRLIQAIFGEFLKFEQKEYISIQSYTYNQIVERLFKYLNYPENVIELIEHIYINHSYICNNYLLYIKNFLDANSKISSRSRKSSQVDMLIITAMEEELDALLLCERGWSKREIKTKIKKASIPTPYYQRTFRDHDDEQFTIAAAYADGKGAKYTAILATHLVLELKPSCIAMTGICAGRPEKTYQGDVIVANQIFDTGGEFRRYFQTLGDEQVPTEELYPTIDADATQDKWLRLVKDFKNHWEAPKDRPKSLKHQKWWFLRNMYKMHETSRYFKPKECEEYQKECPDLKAVVDNLKAEKIIEFDSSSKGYMFTQKGLDKINELFSLNEEYSDPDQIEVRVGSIGTVDKVQKDFELFKIMQEQRTRDVLAVEMEGAAIAAVARKYHIPMLVIKAVQDYGDIAKDYQFREYAAKASAKFLLDFLKKTSSVSKLFKS